MKKLTMRQMLAVASMLFGMFFGAGNLIFPASMGQLAGSSVWLASAGLLITGVLYLTIGPLFAIPRCATVSYTVGVQQLLPGADQRLALALFSLVFFGAVLFFSLRPGELLTWIGKVLNPLFLCFLAVLVVRALVSPLGAVSAAAPMGAYETDAFAAGFLEGYNTMDALAGLAFGIIVVDAIRRLGVTEPGQVAKSTVGAGVFSALLMGLIYVLVAVMAAQSRGLFEPAANGGEALARSPSTISAAQARSFWRPRSRWPASRPRWGW